MLIVKRVAVTVLAGVAFASCTLGPNYTRPAIETPAAHRGSTGAPGSAESLADVKWFDLFRDEQLARLVSAALTQNFEVRIAAERVLQARAAYGIQRADQYPNLDGSLSLNAARASEVGANRAIPRGAATGVSYTDAGFSLGW